MYTFLKNQWKAKKPLNKFRKFIRQNRFLGNKLFNVSLFCLKLKKKKILFNLKILYKIKFSIIKNIFVFHFFQNNKVIPQQENKRSVTFSPLVSRDSMSSKSSHSVIETIKINDVVDWDIVQRKYRQQFSGELEKLPRK